MARYTFGLGKKALVDKIRSPLVYEYNLAENLALLSNDISVVRNFYMQEIGKYFQDSFMSVGNNNKFLAQNIPGQAFSYFGIIPMIVQSKVNLVASNGFKIDSDDKEVDEVLNAEKEDANLDDLFIQGVYWESGIGDFAYRVSYQPNISDNPIIDIIEPHHLEIEYSRGTVKAFIIKEVSDEDASFELCEIHEKNKAGRVCIKYRYRIKGEWVKFDDYQQIAFCETKFGFKQTPADVELPFDDFLVVFKKNTNNNQLYKGERGVPDIQGLASIEDALTEAVSDLIDAIRKGGIREYIDERMLPQTVDGQLQAHNPFNKTVITTRSQSTPGQSSKLVEIVQGNIDYRSYVETIQTLVSLAINKAGLAPTTLGLTGLESINSSAESQDAREKTSLRTREICINSWRLTLKDILNKYLQVKDYIQGYEIMDYSELINITFDDYISPSIENITEVLARQVQAGIKSQYKAIEELNDGASDEQIEKEFAQILTEKGVDVELAKEVDELSGQENISLESSNSIKNANLVNSDTEKAKFEGSGSEQLLESTKLTE